MWLEIWIVENAYAGETYPSEIEIRTKGNLYLAVGFQNEKGKPLFKQLIQKFRNRLKKSAPENRRLQKAPKPILSQSTGYAARPDKIPPRDPREKQKSSGSGRPAKGKELQTDWNVSQFDVPETEGQTRFHDLGLPVKIMRASADLGFQYCTPIQAAILPKALTGSDATGKAQTGTGKSAAFLINIYTQLLSKPLKGKRRPGVPRVLILAPTRELALQIEKDARAIGKYTEINIQSVFGGLGYDKQKRALAEKIVDIIVATPGRLLDFQRQRLVRLYKLEILVIDEADRMLDMGFIPDVRKIVYSTPPKNKRQTMFFGATLTPEVERLAGQWTRDPVHVEVEQEHVAAESINQLIYIVTTEEKFALLLNLITGQNLERVLVFVNRRDQTNRLADRLRRYRINCAVLSGDVPQNKRIKTLENFRNGKIRVLVATDVAARGLHVEGISHVINFTLPHDPEDYVHRIGRTGRAGETGISVSFACEEDSFYIPAIEKYLGNAMHCVQPDASLLEPPPPAKKAASSRSRGRYYNKRPSTRTRRRSRPRSPNKKQEDRISG
jgi:ATP-dependent RNA helicase RhlB